MAEDRNEKMMKIDIDQDLWNRCYTVHSLVIIGSKEEDGAFNFAPKHMAMPLGFGPYFGFVGTPRKTTYQNVAREEAFTVSYPRPSQLIISSLSASRREEDDSKPILEHISTTKARKIEGQFLQDAYFQLECTLSQITGQFGEWELIVGKVVAAYINEKYVKGEAVEQDHAKLIHEHPLLAYLHPDRFSAVRNSNTFPFPKDFKR